MRLVRLRHLGGHPDHPHPIIEPVAGAPTASGPAAPHRFRQGSYLVVDGAGSPPAPPARALSLWLYPTGGVGQAATVLATGSSTAGLVVTLRADCRLAVERRAGTGPVAVGGLGAPLPRRRWTFVALSLDPDRAQVRLEQRSLRGAADSGNWPLPGGWEVLAPPWVMGARIEADGEIVGPWDGKVDQPAAWGAALLPADCDSLAADRPIRIDPLCRWELGRSPGDSQVADAMGRAPGRVVNRPVRAVTGHNWTGRTHDWRAAPQEYGAVHLHSDDLGDAGWPAAVELPIPPGCEEGVHALELTALSGARDWVPFVVRAASGPSRGPLAVLLPTFTYLAYANEPPFPPHVARTVAPAPTAMRGRPGCSASTTGTATAAGSPTQTGGARSSTFDPATATG